MLEVSRVLECCFVENEEVGQACKDVINDDTKEPVVRLVNVVLYRWW